MGFTINKKIDHKKLWIDSMTGMSTGFFSTLIIGSFMSILGMYTTADTVFDQIKYIVGAVTPFAIGMAIGWKAGKSLLQCFAIGLASLIAARSNMFAWIDGTSGTFHLIPKNWGSSTSWDFFNYKDMRSSGDVFAAWLSGVSVLYVFAFFEWESSFDFLVVPLLGILIGFGEGFFLTYVVSLFIRSIEWTIWQAGHQGASATIAMAPIIGLLMGVSLSLPTSSAAMAMALNLSGDAAIAAMAGTAAQMLSFGVMTWWSSKSVVKTLAVSFGTSMLLMPNYSRRPMLLIIPCINSALCALVAVAAFHGHLDYPLQKVVDVVGTGIHQTSNEKVVGSTTVGMGTVALYGQIFTLNDHGWGNMYAWLNVIFIQLMLPVVIATIGVLIFARLGWIKHEWLSLWDDKKLIAKATDDDQEHEEVQTPDVTVIIPLQKEKKSSKKRD